jgi:hypothetical protein
MDPDSSDSLSPININHIPAHTTETSFLEAMQDILLYAPSRALFGDPTNAYQEGHAVLLDALGAL